MKIGLQIVRFDWPGSPANMGSKLMEIGKTADAAGFDSIWAMDHFFQMDMPDMGLKPEEPMLDGYTALSYLAAVKLDAVTIPHGMISFVLLALAWGPANAGSVALAIRFDK